MAVLCSCAAQSSYDMNDENLGMQGSYGDETGRRLQQGSGGNVTNSTAGVAAATTTAAPAKASSSSNEDKVWFWILVAWAVVLAVLHLGCIPMDDRSKGDYLLLSLIFIWAWLIGAGFSSFGPRGILIYVTVVLGVLTLIPCCMFMTYLCRDSDS